MVIVAVNYIPKNEKISEFLEVFRNLVPDVKKEDGCIEYKLHKDLDNNEYFLFEQWASKQDLHNHLQTEHMTKYFVQAKDFFLAPPVIKVFDIVN